ncbi:hypothetical protein SEUCBS139899_002781 [Sporothrix eucalyptigena]|uniref:Uncharacterized protein n=1 Tax=Sporothrix eucalyptigena TaxID=1812306 RepID=A0ABP0CIY6_9PEZI
MAYQQFPYMQAHPPRGYGAPGSTAYFMTQHLGGFYAPISNNPPFPQVHGPAPMLGSVAPTVGPVGSIGSGGQMFNSWPGHPDEQEKKETELKRSVRAERGDKPKKVKKGRPSTPWEKVVASIEAGGDHEDDGGSFDHCDCSGSEGEGSCDSCSSNDEDSDADTEVVIQPGGSASVVVLLNRKKQDCPPKRTCFVVSARRMRSVARGWPHLCRRGTDMYDTTVDDEAAVVGMYWFLQALHTQVADGGNVSGSGFAPATTPRASPTIPAELPARVLAYATLFAHQFGVLQDEPQAIADEQSSATAAAFSPLLGGGDRFRIRAETWLRSITNNPRHRRTLDISAIAPVDWPFVLYTARILGDRQLFATCLRTLLDRWYVNERGVFCDASGPARVDLLPEPMRETVLRDLASFKAAREQSVEAIITGAMNAFDYESSGRN